MFKNMKISIPCSECGAELFDDYDLSYENIKGNIQGSLTIFIKECEICKKDHENELRTAEIEGEDLASEKYKEGHEEGHEEGCKEGHEEGYKEGYEEGHKEGYDKGHKEGYDEGYDNKEGYDEGYDEG